MLKPRWSIERHKLRMLWTREGLASEIDDCQPKRLAKTPQPRQQLAY